MHIYAAVATKMSSNAMAWYIALAALGLCKADFSRCLAECVNYFAGATSNDAMICQKAGGMSGDCYPAYGCAKGMITCVDQAWTGALPDLTDVRTACSGLSDLTAENPWTCGTSEEARPPCVHDTPNNNIGKWLLADTDLGCGWGSYYGKATPNYSGSGTPYTEYFYNVANEQQCCEHAMSFQSSSSTQDGPALFFNWWRMADAVWTVRWLSIHNWMAPVGCRWNINSAVAREGSSIVMLQVHQLQPISILEGPVVWWKESSNAWTCSVV